MQLWPYEVNKRSRFCELNPRQAPLFQSICSNCSFFSGGEERKNLVKSSRYIMLKRPLTRGRKKHITLACDEIDTYSFWPYSNLYLFVWQQLSPLVQPKFLLIDILQSWTGRAEPHWIKGYQSDILFASKLYYFNIF